MWNHDFMDVPLVEKSKQNTPSFSSLAMSGLAEWKSPKERMLFILCGGAGFRIGEALGIEIDKHLSSDFRTISVRQKARHCKVETPVHFSEREATLVIERHPSPSAPGSQGTQLHNPHTGTHKAGNHAFRRFRSTYLRNYTECPEGLYKYWMGHAGKDMSDLDDKIKEDVQFCKMWAERCGFGFELPSVVPNVPKCTENAEVAVAA